MSPKQFKTAPAESECVPVMDICWDRATITAEERVVVHEAVDTFSFERLTSVHQEVVILAWRALQPLMLEERIMYPREDKTGAIWIDGGYSLPLPPYMCRQEDEDESVWDRRLEHWLEHDRVGRAFTIAERELGDIYWQIIEAVETRSRRICRECGAPGSAYPVDVNRVKIWCDECRPRRGNDAR